jgi:hypothetical protein
LPPLLLWPLPALPVLLLRALPLRLSFLRPFLLPRLPRRLPALPPLPLPLLCVLLLCALCRSFSCPLSFVPPPVSGVSFSLSVVIFAVSLPFSFFFFGFFFLFFFLFPLSGVSFAVSFFAGGRRRQLGFLSD